MIPTGCIGSQVYTAAMMTYDSALYLQCFTLVSRLHFPFHILLYYLNPHEFLLLQCSDWIKNQSSTHSHCLPKGLTLFHPTSYSSLNPLPSSSIQYSGQPLNWHSVLERFWWEMADSKQPGDSHIVYINNVSWYTISFWCICHLCLSWRREPRFRPTHSTDIGLFQGVGSRGWAKKWILAILQLHY